MAVRAQRTRLVPYSHARTDPLDRPALAVVIDIVQRASWVVLDGLRGSLHHGVDGVRRHSGRWRHRTGAARVGNRFIRFGWPGCPDVLGQLKDGRLLGVEVKAQAGRLRPEQALFLARIRAAGGVAFVARDCRDVLRTLGEAQAP